MRYILSTLLLLIVNSTLDLTIKNYKPIKELSLKELIVNAIILHESTNDSLAVNKDAVGLLQIRPIMVREVNNILKHKKYKLSDRFDSIKSIEMFYIYTNHHTPSWELELVTRRWNGGENGELKPSTFIYYLTIKQMIDTL